MSVHLSWRENVLHRPCDFTEPERRGNHCRRAQVLAVQLLQSWSYE
jgi:hypothetical protein